MKYLIPGVIAGVLLSLFTMKPESGIQFNAEWTGPVANPEKIEPSPVKTVGDITLPLNKSEGIYHLDPAGRIISHVFVSDRLFAASGNGLYYAGYRQTGRGIELFSSDSSRFWRVESADYPYLSYNSELILLLNGDQTTVRVLDMDAREITGGVFHGRLCTVISFSERGDNAAVGFLDGSFYVVSNEGGVVYSGKTAPDSPIKSAAVSSDGKYAAFHHGDDSGDYLLLIDVANSNKKSVSLNERYFTRAPLYVSRNGKTLFLGRNYMKAYSMRGSQVFAIEIPERREGQASISGYDGFYAAAYTETGGTARLIFFSDRGEPLFTQPFPLDTYGDVRLEEGLIFFRGSDHLYCYSYRI